MADASSAQTPHRIPSLDELWALSIFPVVALHTVERIGDSRHVGWFWYALLSGSSGVFIFLEMSGFPITSLLLNEHAKRDR